MTAIELAEKVLAGPAFASSGHDGYNDLCQDAAPLLAKICLAQAELIDMLNDYSVGVSFLSEERPAAKLAELDRIAKGDG